MGFRKLSLSLLSLPYLSVSLFLLYCHWLAFSTMGDKYFLIRCGLIMTCVVWHYYLFIDPKKLNLLLIWLILRRVKYCLARPQNILMRDKGTETDIEREAQNRTGFLSSLSAYTITIVQILFSSVLLFLWMFTPSFHPFLSAINPTINILSNV